MTPRSMCILSVLLAVALFAPTTATAQETVSKSEIQKELEIMAKVLDESLDQRLKRWTVGPWVTASPFDTGVDATWIPSVGAVFTLSVNFPVIAPAEIDAENPQEQEAEGDLWEKFSKQRAETKGGESSRSADAYNSSIGGWDLAAPGDSAMLRAEGIVVKLATHGRGLPYDRDRFDALRKTLLETLAKYGNKLDALPDSEQIIVRVNAPQASLKVTKTETGKKVVTRPMGAGPEGVEVGIGEGGAGYGMDAFGFGEGDYGFGGGGYHADGDTQDMYYSLITDKSDTRSQDAYFILLPKSEVPRELSADSLEGRFTEVFVKSE